MKVHLYKYNMALKAFAQRQTMTSCTLCVVFIFMSFLESEAVTVSEEKLPPGFTPVVCYYNGWAITRPEPMAYEPEDIPGDLCTDIVFAPLNINNKTWEIESAVPQYVVDPERYNRISALKKKYPLVRILASVGGWSAGGRVFSDMVSDEKRRYSFIKSVLEGLYRFGFDGIDIFWQYPGLSSRNGQPTDKNNFVKLVKEMRAAFQGKFLLTAVVPTDKSLVSLGFQAAELAENLDWINVESINLRGKWNIDGLTDVPSPFSRRSFDEGYFKTHNVLDGLRRLVQLGVPKEKMMVGVSLAGRSYRLKDPKQNGIRQPFDEEKEAEPGPYLQSSEMLSYYEICSKIKDDGWTRVFDRESKCPYAYHKDQWVGYDDEQSIGIKMDLILNEKYGGVVVWDSDLDDFRGECGKTNPILKTINDKLLTSGPEMRFL